MAEYALVTAVMATLAVALTSIPEPQLARQLPTTAARAQALVTKSARSHRVLVADARAAFVRAPFSRAPLRYLYAAGWIGGRLRQSDCVLARVSAGSTEKRILATIRNDARLVTRLRRMRVTAAQAADALTRGTASAC